MDTKILRLKILQILVEQEKTAASPELCAQDISHRLEGTSFRDIDQQLENMEVLGWVNLAKSLGGNYTAWIAPAGRLHWEQVLNEQKKQQPPPTRRIGFRPSEEEHGR